MDDLIKRQDVYNTIMDIFSNIDDMELAGRIAARIQMISTAYNYVYQNTQQSTL